MMGWKIYFWIVITSLVIAFIGYALLIRHLTIRDYADIISGVIDVIGIFAFVYKKNILPSQFWKWYFWINVGVVVFDLLYLYTGMIKLPSMLHSHAVEMDRSGFGFGIIFAIPYFYALHALGEKRQEKMTLSF